MDVPRVKTWFPPAMPKLTLLVVDALIVIAPLPADPKVEKLRLIY
jgi:hypothetical protein